MELVKRQNDDWQDIQIFVFHAKNIIINMFVLLNEFQAFFAWNTKYERLK
jgi:hypothetical protein